MTGWETENALSLVEMFTVGEVPWDVPKQTTRRRRSLLKSTRQKISSKVLLERALFWTAFALIMVAVARFLVARFAFDTTPIALMFPRLELTTLFIAGGPCALASTSYLADRGDQDGGHVFLAILALCIPVSNILLAYRVVSSSMVEALYTTDETDLKMITTDLSPAKHYLNDIEDARIAHPFFYAIIGSKAGSWMNTQYTGLHREVSSGFVERWGSMLRPFRGVPLTDRFGFQRTEFSPLYYLPIQLISVYLLSSVCGLGGTADPAFVAVVAMLLRCVDAATLVIWAPYFSRLTCMLGALAALISAISFAILVALFSRIERFDGSNAVPSKLPTAALAVEGVAVATLVIADGIGISVQWYVSRTANAEKVIRCLAWIGDLPMNMISLCSLRPCRSNDTGDDSTRHPMSPTDELKNAYRLAKSPEKMDDSRSKLSSHAVPTTPSLLRHSTSVNQNLLTRFDSGQVYGLPEDVPDGPWRKTISLVESPELTATSINASPTSSRRYAKPLWGPSATGEMEKFRFNYEGGVDHEGAVSSRPKFADGAFRFVSSSDAATGTVAERARRIEDRLEEAAREENKLVDELVDMTSGLRHPQVPKKSSGSALRKGAQPTPPRVAATGKDLRESRRKRVSSPVDSDSSDNGDGNAEIEIGKQLPVTPRVAATNNTAAHIARIDEELQEAESSRFLHKTLAESGITPPPPLPRGSPQKFVQRMPSPTASPPQKAAIYESSTFTNTQFEHDRMRSLNQLMMTAPPPSSGPIVPASASPFIAMPTPMVPHEEKVAAKREEVESPESPGAILAKLNSAQEMLRLAEIRLDLEAGDSVEPRGTTETAPVASSTKSSRPPRAADVRGDLGIAGSAHRRTPSAAAGSKSSRPPRGTSLRSEHGRANRTKPKAEDRPENVDDDATVRRLMETLSMMEMRGDGAAGFCDIHSALNQS